MRRPVAFQVSWAARARPAVMQRARAADSRASVSMASAIAPVSSGSTSSAAPAVTSGSDVVFDATTGTPDANASTTGIPKPSYSEANTKTPAPAYTWRRSALSTRWFSQTTSELQPQITTFDQSAIRAVPPRGGSPRTLRGCTKALAKPDEGDCSISYAAPAVSPNGRLVAFDAGAQLALMHADGSRFRLLPGHSVEDGDPAFAPDGRRLAFSAGASTAIFDPTPDRGVWVSDLAGANARRLTARGISPAWSVRSWIAFLRADGVYRMRPDGHGLRRLVRRTLCADVAWSPHGTKLAFVCRGRLEVSNGDGSHARRVPGVGATAVAWAPSGRRLAVSIFDGGLETIRLDGSHARQLVPGAFSASSSFGTGGLDWQPLR